MTGSARKLSNIFAFMHMSELNWAKMNVAYNTGAHYAEIRGTRQEMNEMYK